MALEEKDFIEQELKANQTKAAGLSMADLADKNSIVNKGPELEKRESTIPETKSKFDREGLPELPNLRTYHGDVADAVRSGGLSMIKVATREQDRRRLSGVEKDGKQNNYHLILILIASTLFVAGLSAVIIAFLVKSQQATVPVVQTPTAQDIIPADSSVTMDITNLSQTEIQSALAKYLVPALGTGSIEKIVLTENQNGNKITLSALDFLSAIKTSLPQVLETSIVPNQYMFGIYQGNGEAEPFLILETSSDETAFPGMLDWEKTLAFDMEPIMGVGTIAPGNAFVDQVILNHDARVLTNGTTSVFFYTVVNGNIVVIAKSADALGIILDKFRVSAILN